VSNILTLKFYKLNIMSEEIKCSKEKLCEDCQVSKRNPS